MGKPTPVPPPEPSAAWPRRPSRAKEAQRIAEQLSKGSGKTYLLRVSKRTHTGMRIAAAQADKTIKRLILDSLAAAGVEVDPADLADDGE